MDIPSNEFFFEILRSGTQVAHHPADFSNCIGLEYND